VLLTVAFAELQSESFYAEFAEFLKSKLEMKRPPFLVASIFAQKRDD